MPPKTWGSELFDKHPQVDANPRVPEAWANSNQAKLFCKLCYANLFIALRTQDEEEVRLGQRVTVRTPEMISAALWDSGAKPRRWFASRPENILRHLKNCSFQPEAIRNHAASLCIERGYNKSPTRSRNTANVDPGSSGSALGLYSAPTSVAQISAQPSPLSGSPYNLPPVPFPNHSPDLGNSIGLSLTPSQFVAPPPSHSPSPSPLAMDGLPFAPSPAMSPSISAVPDAFMGVDNSRKRPRVTSQTRELTRRASFAPPIWTGDQQARLGIRIARLTVSCGFPYRWVENPEWIALLQEFIPMAQPLSRRQLSDTLIPREIARYRELAKANSAGTLATLQCDGWTGINFHHFLAFMITTSKREVYTVKVFDTSAERKTAENLVTEILEVQTLLQRDWKVEVIAITSDAAGEAKKARKLRIRAEPALITPDCWAHQNALVVGDYMRASSTLISYAEMANEVITWLRSKTQVLALLADVQNGMRASNPSGRVLTVIRPVVTRWTAYFLAYKRLLELHLPLQILLQQHRERLLAGNAATSRKARDILRILENPVFWQSLTRVKLHLEPLARSSSLLQASHARLDQVPIIFGTLLLEYQDIRADTGDNDVIDVIVSSIERRWKSCDQDVYIAAIILHPLLKTAPFASRPFIAPANIWNLMERLWKRFYKVDAPHGLFRELIDYLNNQGIYLTMPRFAQETKYDAELANQVPDPLRMFDGAKFSPSPTPLQILARRILSVCCNSASCERLFSMFGNILTKHRSRLQGRKMVDQAELRMHLRDEHLRDGSITNRLKRKLTSHHHADLSSTAQASSAVSSINPPADTSSATPASSDPSAPNASSRSQAESIANEEEDVVIPDDNNPMGASATTRTSPAPMSFSSMIRTLADDAAAAESEDTEADQDSSSNTASIIGKIALKDLFDFSNAYWSAIKTTTTRNTLADEMELHQLLDLDADGDPDNFEAGNDLTHPAML